MPARGRRGAGLLLGIVLLVLALVSVIGLARRAHASRTLALVRSAAVGSAAYLLAVSALEEALATLATDDQSLAAVALRDAAPEGRPDVCVLCPVPIALGIASHEEASRELELDGGGVTATVLTAGATGASALDRRGRVRFEAVVRHPPTGTVRRLVREHAFRVSRLAAPAPFDQFTWLVLDSAGLRTDDTNPSLARTLEGMETVRGRWAPAAHREVTLLLTRINTKLRNTAPMVGAALELEDVERHVRPFAADRHPVPPAFSASVLDPHHYLPGALALFTLEAELPDLAAADLRPAALAAVARADAARTRCERARSAYRDATARLEELGATSPQTAAEARALLGAYDAWKRAVGVYGEAIGELSAAHQAHVEAIQVYTTRWREAAGRARVELVELARALEVESFRDRAQHRFGGPTAMADLRAFLAGARRGGARVRAAVHVDSSEPLDLAGVAAGGAFEGELVISTTGPVTARQVRLADERRDRLVVCAGGELAAGGEVHATLIALGRFVPAADLDLVGGLVQKSAGDAPLQGRIRRPAGAGRTIELESRVAIGPWAVRTELARH